MGSILKLGILNNIGRHRMQNHGSLFHILFHTRYSCILHSFGTDDYLSFLTTDWFLREEYEKFREGLQGKRTHKDAQSASTSKVVKSGPTMLRSVHGLQSNKCIPVKVNQIGQALGEWGQLLKQFLGTVSRMGNKLSIDVISWRDMPSSNKHNVWDFIQVM
ncbi:hypothetical protein Taro_055938 [Colocasia esculenta]|uniref:Uncharacterized protein n=1 Tax=Colocasia esculenta TaxID=4460 RepID=A0A843XSM9_COLES|nr:hypothetical protein [Colocasia esculenta]